MLEYNTLMCTTVMLYKSVVSINLLRATAVCCSESVETTAFMFHERFYQAIVSE